MGHPLFDLSGKSAVVVGGTSGIGLAMAIGLAERSHGPPGAAVDV